ncbi:MAG: hypothetical protein K6F01_11660 [Selenomonas sp.]|uniref:SGNH/GDSL hydrolase family protein n=1 Tax=Selenomonas sp. TaxID=2053611 RepID=UPI0025F34F58|nr:SGNH/GDSL hydrolase family protein [Selenomonas sp.]MCR5440070.1 hypothetical protein [Selenomonas sp.]
MFFHGKYSQPMMGKVVSAVMAAGLLSASWASAASIPADSPNIQYFGRWDKQAGEVVTGQGAVYIKANFTGTSLKADLGGSQEVWWRVSIDDGPFRRFKAEGEDTLLAQNLSKGAHKVLLVRSTEGEVGLSTFGGFTLDRRAKLLAPDILKNRRLEFVGDSITAGAFNDRWQPGKYHDKEDNNQAYGPILSRMLGADYSILARSGEGVVLNYREKDPKTELHTAGRYVRTFCETKNPGDYNPFWDSRKFPVDAVIVSIGTNDFSLNHEPPGRYYFEAGYRNLLQEIRYMNPGKPIICVAPIPSIIGTNCAKWEANVVQELKAAGEQQLYFIPVNDKEPLLSADDFAGDDTHPIDKGHQKIAEFLKDKVASILGWK